MLAHKPLHLPHTSEGSRPMQSGVLPTNKTSVITHDESTIARARILSVRHTQWWM